MTNTETVGTERPDGHYWVRFGVGHEWEVMLWDGTHFWGTAGDGYRGEDFEVGPQVFPPTSSRGNQPQSPVLQRFEDESGLEGNRLSASCTQSPAEWQVEAILKWVHEDVLPAYGITLEYRDAEMVEGAKEALRAASIHAPEHFKEEAGVRIKPLEWTKLDDFWIRAEGVGQVYEALLDDPHLEERKAWCEEDNRKRILSALETPPLHKEGEAKVGDEVVFCPECGWNSAMDASPAPVPVTITPEVAELQAALIAWVNVAEMLAGEPGMDAHFHDVADATLDVVTRARSALSAKPSGEE